MLHAIIIDDEPRAIKGLELQLLKYVTGVRVVASTTDPQAGVHLINTYRPDIVFLDIHMPLLNGFDMLDQLEFNEFALVFCTAHREYAVRALRVNAVDYLLKPVNAEELKETIARISKKLNELSAEPAMLAELSKYASPRTVRIPLLFKDRIDYIQTSALVYIEADSHHSMVTLITGETIKANGSLKEYENMLCQDESPFIRVQYSFIVNMNHITRYLKEDGGYVVMKGSKRIPVSKAKKDELFRRLHLVT
jgi:two-component system, LytTR family, response regulator